MIELCAHNRIHETLPTESKPGAILCLKCEEEWYDDKTFTAKENWRFAQQDTDDRMPPRYEE